MHISKSDNAYNLQVLIKLYINFVRCILKNTLLSNRRGHRGGSGGSTPHLSWKKVGSFLRGGEFFFGKIRHNKQKLSINLTFFPFSFNQMFTNSSF